MDIKAKLTSDQRKALADVEHHWLTKIETLQKGLGLCDSLTLLETIAKLRIDLERCREQLDDFAEESDGPRQTEVARRCREQLEHCGELGCDHWQV